MIQCTNITLSHLVEIYWSISLERGGRGSEVFPISATMFSNPYLEGFLISIIHRMPLPEGFKIGKYKRTKVYEINFEILNTRGYTVGGGVINIFDEEHFIKRYKSIGEGFKNFTLLQNAQKKQ